MDGETKGKILLTGTCWYELTGLWFLLSAQGHNVYRVPPGYPCARHGWDLIIVALSAAPVAGWGRHLSRLRELRAEIFGEMMVLVPERLEMLKCCEISVRCTADVYLCDLERTVRMTLNRKSVCTGKFRLSA